jgi:peptide deformylase
MAILPVYLYGSDILREKAADVKTLTDNLRRFINDMMDTMHAADAIGLAANQVGKAKRIIVVDISETEEGKSVPPIVMINPVVVSAKGKWKMEEGCLSLPEIREEITRPEIVGIRFRDEEFSVVEREFSGLFGRVILHEMDHLDGVLLTDHLSRTKRTLMRNRLRKITKKKIDTDYPVIVDQTMKRRKKKVL